MTNGTLWQSHLINDRWFAQLPAGLQDALLGAARQRRITPGKRLFAKGDAPCGLYALLGGGVRMGAAQGQRHVPRTESVRLPFWFGEVSLFDGLPRTLDAYAWGQSIFLQVPQPFIETLLEQNPQYLRHFAGLLSSKLGLPLPNPQKRLALPERARVAWRLLLLCEGYGLLSHARRLVELPAIEQCSSVNLPTEAVRKVLETLQKRGVLRLAEDHVEVLDVDKLRTLAIAPR